MDRISQQIIETAYYAGENYHAIAELAAVIEGVVGEDKLDADIERRTRYRREFKRGHGLTTQVWARVPKRFNGMQVERGDHAGLVVRDYKKMSEKQIRSASYLCQLATVDFLDLYDAVQDNLDEHSRVLAQVNEVLEAARQPRAAGYTTLARQTATLVGEMEATKDATVIEWAMKFAAIPAVKKAMEKERAK